MLDALLFGFVTVSEENYIEVSVRTIDIEVGESIRFFAIGESLDITITALFTPPGIGNESGLKIYDFTSDEEEIFKDSSVKTLIEAEKVYKRFTESSEFKDYLPGFYNRAKEF